MPSSTEGTGPAVRRAFLIADIRGYSTFTRERGDATAARLATRFADLARDAVAGRSGRVIELRGDEALAVFEAADQAVRAGLEFQKACRESTDREPDLPLPVGIGIAAGDAVPVEDGYRGAALNLAARLCSRATAGQVLVTGDVAGEAAADGDLAFRALEAVELKGFDRPVEPFEARSTRERRPPVVRQAGPVPLDLDDPGPLVGREDELRWLRGTWRQVRRGNGRIVFLSGPAGMGTTRLAAALAGWVAADGGIVRSAGAGAAAGARALTLLDDAATAPSPTLYVLDGISLFPRAVEHLAAAGDSIESGPSLVLAIFQEAAGTDELARLVARIDRRGDAHRVLGPLDRDAVHELARATVPDADEFPAESVLRTTGGVPARVVEAVDEWARAEAARRLAAAAEWMAEGRNRRAAGLDFAGTLIARNLGRIYGVAGDGEPAVDCPYRGLAAFGEDDAPFFFGRERMVGEVAARTVGTGFLGVVGPSGSGKSSLVMAGLLPSLAAGLLPGSAGWGQVVMRPGEHPMDALERAVLAGHPGTRLVLVVDQFEEAFTTTAVEAEREAFVGRLAELAGDPEGCVVVVTIRADYTGHCAPYPTLARLLASNLILVGPMTPEETRRAIELPARRVGLRVESGLTDTLVEEVGDEPGALPLLSTALVELWNARDDGWLRLDAHRRTGGIRGAVSRLAEASYDELSPSERESARSIFLRLVGRGEGESAVRRRAPVAEFDVGRDATADAVLDRLVADRLLMRDDDRVEIAHEALIREWPRLRDWLDDDAAGRQLRAHLTQSAGQWQDRGRDAGDLYRGARLSATLDWAHGRDRELNDLEREFLAQSRQAGEREAERQRRTNRRLRGLLIGTAVFLAVALVAGALALVQRGRARTAQAAAESEALTSDAERMGSLAGSEPSLDRALLLAVAGVRLRDLPETRGDLLSVLQTNPALVRFATPSRTNVTAIAVSPDGRTAAVGDSAGVVRFLDLSTWHATGAPVRLDGPVSQQAMAFAPDGRSVAVGTATSRRTADLYVVDPSSSAARRLGSWPSVPAAAGPLRFIRMAFDPSGAGIAVAVATAAPESPVPAAVRLLFLDAATGRPIWDRDIGLARGQNEDQVEFTPDGTLVTSAQQGPTLLWNADTGAVERRFPIGGPFAVSPDGRTLAVAQNSPNPFDPTAGLSLLDLATGKSRPLDALPVKAWIIAAAFTPDGRNVVAGSFDGALRVWDASSGTIRETFTGQPSGVNVAAVPDTGTVLSGSSTGSVAAWDVGGTGRLGATFRWRSSNAGCSVTPCFAVDPSGHLLAESLSRGRTGLLDLRSHHLVAMLPANDGAEADAIAFTPDGRTLITGGLDGTITMWDVATRTARRSTRLPGPVWWVAVSPDGRSLAVQWKAQDDSVSRVEVTDTRTGDEVFIAAVPNGKGGLAFSPDGRSLAALGCCQPDSTVVVWNARTGAERFRPTVPGHATSVTFSPDGRLLAVGTEDGKIVLFDPATGRPVGAPIPAATGAVDPVSFSPDGRLLAASSQDQTVTLWDLASRRRIGTTFPVEAGAVPVARFAPDGDLVIDYTVDTSVWPVDLRGWVAFACRAAGRDLTPGEWRDQLPERPYRRVCPP
ncbi:MAG TPA: PQQ-binding-like beta-propeller repeat protein [Actinomycetota bacterium]